MTTTSMRRSRTHSPRSAVGGAPPSRSPASLHCCAFGSLANSTRPSQGRRSRRHVPLRMGPPRARGGQPQDRLTPGCRATPNATSSIRTTVNGSLPSKSADPTVANLRRHAVVDGTGRPAGVCSATVQVNGRRPCGAASLAARDNGTAFSAARFSAACHAARPALKLTTGPGIRAPCSNSGAQPSNSQSEYARAEALGHSDQVRHFSLDR